MIRRIPLESQCYPNPGSRPALPTRGCVMGMLGRGTCCGSWGLAEKPGQFPYADSAWRVRKGDPVWADLDLVPVIQDHHRRHEALAADHGSGPLELPEHEVFAVLPDARVLRGDPVRRDPSGPRRRRPPNQSSRRRDPGQCEALQNGPAMNTSAAIPSLLPGRGGAAAGSVSCSFQRLPVQGQQPRVLGGVEGLVGGETAWLSVRGAHDRRCCRAQAPDG